MDIVVTVPKKRWQHWLDEGDGAGEHASGYEYGYRLMVEPQCTPGDRVYITCNQKIRGYALLKRIEHHTGGFILVRGGGAVAVTIDQQIPIFRGFRYRWWNYSDEHYFPRWHVL